MLIELPCLDAVPPVNAAVSDSGELAAENDVVHVAVAFDLLVAVTGWVAQPGIEAPLDANSTFPAGATFPLVFV